MTLILREILRSTFKFRLALARLYLNLDFDFDVFNIKHISLYLAEMDSNSENSI